MNTDKSLDVSSNNHLMLREITEQIIGAAFEVHNTLGSGFLEKVYENALALELRNRKVNVAQQRGISVQYKGGVVGEYVADLLVENCVLVELKTVAQLTSAHEAQLINYLKATGIKVGLLINFHGTRIQWKRLVV